MHGEPIRMLEVNAEQKTNSHNNSHAAQIVDPAIAAARTRIIKLVRTWSQPKERYADLRSRVRTPSARELVFSIYHAITDHEQKTGSRVRQRHIRSGLKFTEALERFIGDFLRAKADTTAPALVYRSVGKSSFTHDPVKYDMFVRALDGLRALELVGHRKGQTRYRKSEFDPGEFVSTSLPGRAARSWATGKLLRLAAEYGIDSSNIGEHFALEPPKHPLVLRDYATGRGRNREQGRIVKYKRTPETERLEADIRELNDFLARFDLRGGTHYGYTRVFNNLSWKAGGRLYSPGERSYQQMPEAERLKMTINGKSVAEIDIKASQLTIYHAMVEEPLEGSSDPYAHAGIERQIAKQWVVASFGNGKPITRWPSKMIEDYKKDTGNNLSKLAKAKDVARKMLDAFPALQRLEDHSNLWADLQYREAEAVIGTMLILMREHRVPSLSMHDGIIVPRSKADLAKAVLTREFLRVVGVEPMVTVESAEEERKLRVG
jgi:hypothetical protein